MRTLPLQFYLNFPTLFFFESGIVLKGIQRATTMPDGLQGCRWYILGI